jgi:unsaturated rhamnogalacturonyl hydrolase
MISASLLPRGLDRDQSRALYALLGMQRQSWEQGVTGHALLDLECHDLVRVVARDAVTRQTPAGKLAEIDDHGIVNCAANGEAVRWTAHHDVDDELRAAFDRQLHWVRSTAPRAEDGTLLHIEGTREVWVDSVYMVVPFLVLAGHTDEAAAQLAGHRRRLYDASAQLYAHQWDEDAQRLIRPAHWGTGNGWVVAGLARALRHLGRPRDDRAVAFRDEASAHAREVIDACLTHRDDSGLFHDVVDDPATFEEANLAQMLAYAILTGVADGWLPDEYVEVGRSLVTAARRQLDHDGFVRPVCGAPHFDRPGTSAEAQAFFLLATAADAAGQRRLGSPVDDGQEANRAR